MNSAVSRVPWADCFFTLDWRWLEKYSSLLGSFGGERYAAIPEIHRQRFSHLGLTFLRKSWEDGISEYPGEVKLRANSGYGAVQIGILKGAKRITLYGFDMLHGVSGREDPNDSRPEETSRYAQWRAEFEKLFAECAKRGIVITHGDV